MALPLSGIRVLEVCHMLAGPYCGMVLADLGAEVIKIEPSSGDIARSVGPHTVGRYNVYFASLNRNKRSLCLDLSAADDRRVFGRLASESHALITNLRPAAIKKLGLTYAAMRQWNERIVCLALTGFGLDGPYADRPAYDYVIQALTGIMALTGDPDASPTKTGYSVVDNSAGLMGAIGLLAKIVEGKGGQIDVSLHDTMLSQMNYLAAAYLNAGERPVRQASGAHPYIVPAQIFATRDGHLALFISHDRFWQKFCTVVGQPDWASDSRFATMKARSLNREAVVAAVAQRMLERATQAWVKLLAAHGIVVAGVETLDAALDGALVAERRMVASVSTPDGILRLVANPIRIDGADQTGYAAPPLLGEANPEFAARPPP